MENPVSQRRTRHHGVVLLGTPPNSPEKQPRPQLVIIYGDVIDEADPHEVETRDRSTTPSDQTNP